MGRQTTTQGISHHLVISGDCCMPNNYKVSCHGAHFHCAYRIPSNATKQMHLAAASFLSVAKTWHRIACGLLSFAHTVNYILASVICSVMTRHGTRQKVARAFSYFYIAIKSEVRKLAG